MVAAVAALLLVVATPVAAGPGEPQVRRDILYGTANGKSLLLDAYLPASGGDRRPAVVMIHGGGWRAGDKASWGPEAAKLAQRGWVAFSVNYRLDEPGFFPAEVDDVQTAVRWVRSHARDYGVDPSRIAALGESAGGHLAAMLATLGTGPLDEGARIRVGAAWSPPVDLTALARSRGDGWIARVMGCTLATCPDRLAQASPVTHVDGDDAPLYLVNSTDELVPLSQARAMAARLQAAGVEHRLDVLPGRRHALDFREEAWAPTVAFLDKHLNASTSAGSSRRPWSVVLAVVSPAVVIIAASVLVWRRRRRRSAVARG
ncbi:MAG: alpha/beta hydrolase [Actinomycetota bacterium]|nr:alpha/beta hydrolase [Actinomycetota bacterium]